MYRVFLRVNMSVIYIFMTSCMKDLIYIHLYESMIDAYRLKCWQAVRDSKNQKQVKEAEEAV